MKPYNLHIFDVIVSDIKIIRLRNVKNKIQFLYGFFVHRIKQYGTNSMRFPEIKNQIRMKSICIHISQIDGINEK